MKIIGYLLIVIHLILGIWAVGGVMELILEQYPWPSLTNPEFPLWLLIVHWGSILFAATSFLYGYFTRWTKTPQIMTLAYGIMALVCVIETIGYMTSDLKYFAMAAEYITYIVILVILYRSAYFTEKFSS